MATPELTTSGMMSLARLQMAPLSPTNMEAGFRNSSSIHIGTNNFKGDEPRYDCLGMNLSRSDLHDVHEFEKRWAEYVQLKSLSGQLPKGQREHRIEQLQAEIRVIQEKRQTVEGDLLRQLAAIRESADSLEFLYSAKKQKASQEQQELYLTLTQNLHNVSESNHIRDKETFPWFYFLRQLDREIARKKMASNQSGNYNDDNNFEKKAVITKTMTSLDTMDNEEGESSKILNGSSELLQRPTAIRPSNRALCLAEIATPKKEEGDDGNLLRASADEELLRAYRIDHALLSTHVSMLHREMERYEKRILAHEMAGNFLTQHNVWRILSSSASQMQQLMTAEDEKDKPEEDDRIETSSSTWQHENEEHLPALHPAREENEERNIADNKDTAVEGQEQDERDELTGETPDSITTLFSADHSVKSHPPLHTIVSIQREESPFVATDLPTISSRRTRPLLEP